MNKFEEIKEEVKNRFDDLRSDKDSEEVSHTEYREEVDRDPNDSGLGDTVETTEVVEEYRSDDDRDLS